MTKRIFRSILGVSLAVLLASLVLIVGVLHGYFQDRVSGELESLAEYIAHGVEENGTDYLTEDLPGSYRITWVDADGTVLLRNRSFVAVVLLDIKQCGMPVGVFLPAKFSASQHFF